jgi:hypothetical protein
MRPPWRAMSICTLLLPPQILHQNFPWDVRCNDLSHYQTKFLAISWLTRSRSTTPSNTSIFQILFNFSIKLPCDRNSINSRKIIIDSNPLGGPAFSWIHNGGLSLKKGCRTNTASFRIVGLAFKNSKGHLWVRKNNKYNHGIDFIPSSIILPYLEMDNSRILR